MKGFGPGLVHLAWIRLVSLGGWPPSRVTVRCCLVRQSALVIGPVFKVSEPCGG